jgi:hypothetical protein
MRMINILAMIAGLLVVAAFGLAALVDRQMVARRATA